MSHFLVMYYCVANGRRPGIYLSWLEAKKQVFKFSGARHKKFFSITDAEKYMKTYCTNEWVFEDDINRNQITNYFSPK